MKSDLYKPEKLKDQGGKEKKINNNTEKMQDVHEKVTL